MQKKEKHILRFRTKQVSKQPDIAGFEFRLWKPTFLHPTPPGKNLKYLFYYLFYLLRIFKNKNYAAVLVYQNTKLVASLLIVPAYYKWPFMSKNDVQFTYVMTNKECRGKGIAAKMISFGASKLESIKSYWYVTDSDNFASIRVAEKIGFVKVN